MNNQQIADQESAKIDQAELINDDKPLREYEQEQAALSQLHKDAGLAYAGINEDEEHEWIGTDKAFEKYQNLEEIYYRNKELN